MSIQTELTRLTNAKAAIKAAIEGKGVTVPEATLLDGMAALIESIEAGGGGGGGGGVDPFSEIVTGTVTVSDTGLTMPIPTLSNLLAVFAIRIDEWGAAPSLSSKVIQSMFVSNSLKFGNYSRSFSSCLFYDERADRLDAVADVQSIGDGEVRSSSGFWIAGTYWYACICGNKI